MNMDFWERHKKYMESGMTFGEALNQVELDSICEWHDSKIDELYPSKPIADFNEET